jgi:short subunit dehydrogenase-like uncharacterized protein
MPTHDHRPADRLLPRRRDRSRRYDLVLWGATGFTGRLVAEYLTEHHGAGDLRWALGGRSRDKLEGVRAELARIEPRAAELPIEVGDSHDHAALGALAARTEVMCSTVGPYARYGSPLLAACVEQGTDYCDLTGEVQWIRRMIDRHHDQARRSGARIVPCCGFDAIPSDLGCLMLQEHARAVHGSRCDAIELEVVRLGGGYSGGTVASMANLFEEASRDAAVRAVLRDLYALNPEGERTGPRVPDQLGLGRDRRGWTGPFLMAAVNTRIVRRSNALLGWAYGRDFRYLERARFDAGPRGLLRAVTVIAQLSGLATALTLPPLRALLQRYALPAPGEGPSREAMARGRFDLRLMGRGRDGTGRPFELRGRVAGKGDPGYSQTAVMLAESALCLARDGGELGCPGGILTPASSMGMRLVERLRRAGHCYEVEG